MCNSNVFEEIWRNIQAVVLQFRRFPYIEPEMKEIFEENGVMLIFRVADRLPDCCLVWYSQN